VIPAIWRIDIEPDEFPSASASSSWSGFVAMVALLRELRQRLADRSGVAGHPTWFVRFDPDLERSYGRVDAVVDEHRGLIDELRAQHDPFGVHVHYHRWDERRNVPFSDHADLLWITHCFDAAAKTFERCFGEPVRRSSQGGYFLHERVVDRAIAAGVEVDVTAEPGLPAKAADPSLGAYATAATSDFRFFPRRPYYPSRTSLGVPAASPATARSILIVPLTAYDYETALIPWPRQIARRVLHRPRQHLPLNPWKAWRDPKTYWDLVARATDEGPAPYFAFAIRTDGPDSPSHQRARALLEYLPSHPLSGRLHFVDPLSPRIAALARPPSAVMMREARASSL
jgi:hypothetical protein